LQNILSKIFEIAKPKVVFASIFISTVIFLITSNFVLSLVVFLLIVSLYGFLDLWYKEKEANLESRRVVPHNYPIFTKVFENTYIPQTVEEFKYEGFIFKILRVENFPPSSLTYPLCPNCKGFLVENVKKSFPVRISMMLKCNSCNISYKSNFTINELVRDVAQHFGIKIQ